MNQPVSNADLSQDDEKSAGDNPQVQFKTDIFDAQAGLYKQRHDQRKWLFISALVAAAVMVVAFMAFVASVLCWVWKNPENRFDWHILLLGSALIIPPTMVVWNLMKQVFRSDGKLENGKGSDGGTGLLWSDLLKECLNVLKEFLSKKKDG